jgi:hypothetical protein
MMFGDIHTNLAGAAPDRSRLIGLISVTLFGNLGAFLLCWYLINWDLSLCFSVPIICSVVLAAVVALAAILGLLRRNYKYQRAALVVVAWNAIIWLFIMYEFWIQTG